MAGSVFLSGKLPAHGDFVARGLGPAARNAWDLAGAAMMQELRQAAGAAFDAQHVASPPWRFVTKGEAGWRAGALAPSIDAVGRRFLVVIGVEALAAGLAGAAGLVLAEAAEAMLYEALGSALDADGLFAAAEARFQALLGELAVPAAALGCLPVPPGLWWTLGSADFAPAVVRSGAPPADLLARTVAPVGAFETAS